MFAKRTFHSTIFWLVLLLSVALNVFLVTKCYYGKPTWTKCKIAIQTDDGKKPVPQDDFFGKSVVFYQSLLNWQFAIIGIILVLGFLSSYYISRRQIRDILDDEFYSEHFKDHYFPKLEKIVIDKFNNSEVFSIIADLTARLVEVENTIDLAETDIKPTRRRINSKPTKKATNTKKQSTKKVQRRKDASDGND